MALIGNSSKILILYVGGTLGMVLDPVKKVLVPSSLKEQMGQMPELQHPTMPAYTVLQNDVLVDSSDMVADDWLRMARVIEQHYYDYDGFLVIMGTDTMAYCASALSFVLENLSKPVIITGAISPLCEVISDARRNLATAMMIAGSYDIPEVCLFFNSHLLRGCRSSKIRNEAFDAFESPNFPPLGSVGSKVHFHKELWRSPPKGRFRTGSLNFTNVAVLHLLPGLDNQIVKNMLQPPLQGIVIRAFGSGNAPQQPAFLSLIEEANQRGIIVVVCSQCIMGNVDMGRYATGSALRRTGAIGTLDMTLEATVTKLAYLLSKKLPLERVREEMQKNLRGELSDEPVQRPRL
jgi:L-asparaginase